MTDVTVRRPRAEDRDALLALYTVSIVDAFEREGVGDETEEINEMIAQKMAQFDADIASGGKARFFLVAETDGRIVGAACHGPCSDLICKLADRDVLEIHEISAVYIHPGFQRRGVMKSLLRGMLHDMQDKGMAQFCLDSGFQIAVSVWAHIFGAPSVAAKDYWGEGFDHCIWFRDIEDVLNSGLWST